MTPTERDEVRAIAADNAKRRGHVDACDCDQCRHDRAVLRYVPAGDPPSVAPRALRSLLALAVASSSRSTVSTGRARSLSTSARRASHGGARVKRARKVPPPASCWADLELGPGRYVLGVDTGLATLGWALTDAVGRPLALGRCSSSAQPGLRVAEDLAYRVDRQVVELGTVIDRVMSAGPEIELELGIEAMSWPRSSKAIAAIALCWGGLVGLARSRGLVGYHVPPAVWERAIASGGHDQVAARLQAYLQEQRPELAAWLLLLRADDRLHPTDALGIAVATAVARELCTRIDAPVPDPARAHQQALQRAQRARRRKASNAGAPSSGEA